MRGVAKGSGATQVDTLNMVHQICGLLAQVKHSLVAVSPMLELTARDRFEAMRANLSTMYDDLAEVYEANIQAALATRDEERKHEGPHD